MNDKKKVECQDSSSRSELERFRLVLGRRLRFVREEVARGGSPAKFGSLFKRSKSTVTRYEDGERDADAWYLHQLTQEYGLSEAWMLSGVGEAQPVEGFAVREGRTLAYNPKSPLTDISYQEILDDISLVVREVEEIMQEQEVTMTPEGKGKLMALVFDYLVTRSEEVDEPVGAQILRLMKFGT